MPRLPCEWASGAFAAERLWREDEAVIAADRGAGELVNSDALPLVGWAVCASVGALTSLAVLVEVVCGEGSLNVALRTFMNRTDSGLCFRRGEQRIECCGECVAAGRLLGVALVFCGRGYAVHSVPSFSNEGELRGTSPRHFPRLA